MCAVSADASPLQVDLFYLHNAAEMQLQPLGRPAFMQRLRAAFVWAEEQRGKGRLQAYGMATWDCFRTPPGHAAYLSLQDVLALAIEVAGEDHGFRSVATGVILHNVTRKLQCRRC